MITVISPKTYAASKLASLLAHVAGGMAMTPDAAKDAVDLYGAALVKLIEDVRAASDEVPQQLQQVMGGQAAALDALMRNHEGFNGRAGHFAQAQSPADSQAEFETWNAIRKQQGTFG